MSAVSTPRTALHAAAALCGAITKGPDHQFTLPLAVDVTGQHRRHIWTAWHASGRASRWCALRALGADIRANRDPASLEAYRPPLPFERRTETRNGEVRSFSVDPEDADYSPPAKPFVYAGQGMVQA